MNSTYSVDEKKVIYADLDPKEGVVLNLNTKNYYRLNETGQIIWQGICAGDSVEKIAQKISDDYDVEREDALKDIEDTVEKFKREQLIQSTEKENTEPEYSIEKAQNSKKKKK